MKRIKTNYELLQKNKKIKRKKWGLKKELTIDLLYAKKSYISCLLRKSKCTFFKCINCKYNILKFKILYLNDKELIIKVNNKNNIEEKSIIINNKKYFIQSFLKMDNYYLITFKIKEK